MRNKLPRGFKVDYGRTQIARVAKIIRDKRSFVSLPKHTHGDAAVPHLILEGVDKGPIRAEIFRRDREAQKGSWNGLNRCWKCGRQVFENSEDAPTLRSVGQWHHDLNKAGQRCDCPENSLVSCSGGCHEEEHPQVQFGQHKEISKESKINLDTILRKD
jgi:hypothetical protein